LYLWIGCPKIYTTATFGEGKTALLVCLQQQPLLFINSILLGKSTCFPKNFDKGWHRLQEAANGKGEKFGFS
jgi:hypothetical protein